MQVLITPEATGWPAILTLNAANDWERQLLQVMAFRLDAVEDLTLNGYRLNVTLEAKHDVAEPEPLPEPGTPPAPPPKDPGPMAAPIPVPGESAADPTN